VAAGAAANGRRSGTRRSRRPPGAGEAGALDPVEQAKIKTHNAATEQCRTGGRHGAQVGASVAGQPTELSAPNDGSRAPCIAAGGAPNVRLEHAIEAWTFVVVEA
jgi:hypothetical protein